MGSVKPRSTIEEPWSCGPLHFAFQSLVMAGCDGDRQVIEKNEAALERQLVQVADK
jgi:hypothetical protein